MTPNRSNLTSLLWFTLGVMHGFSSITMTSYLLERPDDKITFIAKWEVINIALLIQKPDFGLGLSLSLFYTIMRMRNNLEGDVSIHDNNLSM